MKKIVIYLIFFMVFPIFALSSELQYSHTAGLVEWGSFGQVTSTKFWSCSWNVSNNGQDFKLDKLNVAIGKDGTPPNSVFISVYSAFQNKTPNQFIANSTNYALSADIDAAGSFFMFNFENQTLQSDTQYTIVYGGVGYSNAPNRWMNMFDDNTGSKQSNWGSVNTGESLYQWTTEWANGDCGLEVYGNNYTTPTIRLEFFSVSPINNTILNTNNFNISYIPNASKITIENCSLYIDSIINSTDSSVSNTNVNYFNNTYLGEDSYLWEIKCVSNNSVSYSTGQFNITIDQTNPIGQNTFMNGSIYLIYDNLSVSFNFSDENLIHSYNITIDSLNIALNESVNKQYINVNLSYNLSGLSLGKHTLKVRYADGHTDEELLNPVSYNPGKCLLGDCLKYEFEAPYKYGNIKIKQKDSSIFDKWNTYQKKDRFSFQFEPSNKKSDYTFTIETDSKYYIVNNDKYGQWIIYNNHWIDFSPYKPSIKRISDTLAEVYINNVDPEQDLLEFNSIGDLNIVEENYTFYINNFRCYNITSGILISCPQTISLNRLQYQNITYTSQLSSFNLSLNIPPNMVFSSGYIVYNNTPYLSSYSVDNRSINMSKDIIIPNYNGNKNIVFYWKVLLNNLEIRSLSYFQNVLYINALNVSKVCSVGYTAAFNFTFKDETNLTSLTAQEVDYTLTYGYFGNSSTFVIYGKTLNVTSLHICVNSSYPSYYIGYGELKYKINSYQDRSYYLFSNTRATSTTSKITLYSLLTSLATSFQITAQTTSLNPYSGKYIQLMRWYPNLNSYNVVEMGKTDDLGNSVVRVKTEDVDYRIGLYHTNGSLIELVNPMRMVCLATPCSYTLNIGLLTTDYISIYGIEYSLDFDETTGEWIFIYNDPSQRTNIMNMTIYKDTPTASYVICSDQDTGYIGVLSCNTLGYTGKLRADVIRSASPFQYITQKIVNIGSNLFKSTLGLWLSLLLAIPIIFVLSIISPIGAIVGGVISLIPALYLGSINLGVVAGIGVLGGIVAHFLKRIS